MGAHVGPKYHKKAKQDTIALVPQANKRNWFADAILDPGAPASTEVSRNERRGVVSWCFPEKGLESVGP
jgi:hypothetical protein